MATIVDNVSPAGNRNRILPWKRLYYRANLHFVMLGASAVLDSADWKYTPKNILVTGGAGFMYVCILITVLMS
jgi:hypothetical protein